MLCLNWEFDADFVQLLDEACQKRQLTLLQVTPENVEAVKQALAAGEVQYRAFYDRGLGRRSGFSSPSNNGLPRTRPSHQSTTIFSFFFFPPPPLPFRWFVIW